ncbi:hypothetical protein SteCoe_20462 [Stentor coeruleus]|uniref:Uncharacterized protein n=1 Tax=Stentor coeruleus TaxID=5963 RepID=A0A1R2BRR4_9CILI|nr:hypothetical protein SteCoe_20462 [Stentor coeruleus]
MWCSGTKKTNEGDVIREHIQHVFKLNTIKPRINTNPPKSMMHLKNKLKAETLKFETNFLIQTENQKLLQKMYEIDSRPQTSKKLLRSSSYKSLNRGSRIQSLEKITEENQGLLSRLQKTKSSYSIKKWIKQHEFSQYISSKLSENSRRVPRMAGASLNYTMNVTGTSNSRPGTSSEKNLRPSTAGKRFYHPGLL